MQTVINIPRSPAEKVLFLCNKANIEPIDHDDYEAIQCLANQLHIHNSIDFETKEVAVIRKDCQTCITKSFADPFEIPKLLTDLIIRVLLLDGTIFNCDADKWLFICESIMEKKILNSHDTFHLSLLCKRAGISKISFDIEKQECEILDRKQNFMTVVSFDSSSDFIKSPIIEALYQSIIRNQYNV